MQIRHAVVSDVEEMSRIERVSYPEEEGATRDSIMERVLTFPDHFWLLEEGGSIRAFINGMVTDEKDLKDEMYDHAKMHKEKGDWQMIFSVVTDPDSRGKGYAGLLLRQVIEDARKQGRKGVVLTCKEHMLGFYGRFGFENEGLSRSTHGHVPWYQMRVVFRK